jgi:hypothetical protein
MKLQEVIEKAKAEGYTHATDDYSYRAKKIDNIKADEDTNQYAYYDGEAIQLTEFPSNRYTFYKIQKGPQS